jgi:hypothetical protein
VVVRSGGARRGRDARRRWRRTPPWPVAEAAGWQTGEGGGAAGGPAREAAVCANGGDGQGLVGWKWNEIR